jgi:hypothetical protein
MGEILPDGSIQGYAGICPNCGKEAPSNIQGNFMEHGCSKDKVYDWVDNYYENVGDECGGCQYSYYESDTNFGMCRAADNGTPENCPQWKSRRDG